MNLTNLINFINLKEVEKIDKNIFAKYPSRWVAAGDNKFLAW
jgi:hypothetical protein